MTRCLQWFDTQSANSKHFYKLLCPKKAKLPNMWNWLIADLFLMLKTRLTKFTAYLIMLQVKLATYGPFSIVELYFVYHCSAFKTWVGVNWSMHLLLAKWRVFVSSFFECAHAQASRERSVYWWADVADDNLTLRL